jgi:hypothetical protein
MRNLRQTLRAALLVLSLATPVMFTGCGGGVGVSYRVRDPYYGDYHSWDDHERGYYVQWARETHHDEHRDVRKLNHNDQKEYWEWRHQHDDKH